MGRKNRHFGTPTPTPSALGDSHLDSATNTIDTLCQRTVSAMTEYELTRDDTIRALFTPDVLNRAVAARELIDPSRNIVSYDINVFGRVEVSVKLSINYKMGAYEYPPINDSALSLQETSGPLLRIIEQTRGIYEQFEELKAVLRWFNRNATSGAIRFYFPAVLGLCPNSPPIKALQHVPTRYTNPPDIGDWMQSIRDASAVYANAQMLPASAVERDRKHMWLTFASYKVQRGQVSFMTDQRTYNL